MDFEIRHRIGESEPDIGVEVVADRDRRVDFRAKDSRAEDFCTEQPSAERAALSSDTEDSPDVSAIKIFLIMAALTAAMALLFRLLT